MKNFSKTEHFNNILNQYLLIRPNQEDYFDTSPHQLNNQRVPAPLEFLGHVLISLRAFYDIC